MFSWQITLLSFNTRDSLVTTKTTTTLLSSSQVIPIDNHVGVSFAGLTADAKSLGRWMRTECLNNRYFHNAPIKIENLATDLGNKMQMCIQVRQFERHSRCRSVY
jgi:20S proteasome subunit alpha 6